MKEIDPEKWIEERFKRYDKWIKDGEIPFSSKVIPIDKSIESKQWILPTNQALEILKKSKVFVLIDCDCRIMFKRCENPVRVCFLIDDSAQRYIDRGEGQQISIDEARLTLEKANEYGLIHLAIYNPEQQIYALCSCCECCCHDLQILRKYNRRDFISHSDYIARRDDSKCTNCGLCIKRCKFSAIHIQNDRIKINIDQCFGCGLCVTTCPEEAIRMEFKK